MPEPQPCLTCGFLTVRGREVIAPERQALGPGRAPAGLLRTLVGRGTCGGGRSPTQGETGVLEGRT